MAAAGPGRPRPRGSEEGGRPGQADCAPGRAASPGDKPRRLSVAVNSRFPVTIYSRIAWLRGAAAGGRSAVRLPARPEGSARCPNPASPLSRGPPLSPWPDRVGEGTQGLCWDLRLRVPEEAGALGPRRGQCDPRCPLQQSRRLGASGGATHSRAPSCPNPVFQATEPRLKSQRPSSPAWELLARILPASPVLPPPSPRWKITSCGLPLSPASWGNRTSSNSPARTCAPPKALSTLYPQLTTLST